MWKLRIRTTDTKFRLQRETLYNITNTRKSVFITDRSNTENWVEKTGAAKVFGYMSDETLFRVFDIASQTDH